jgi:hypothetical protein
VADGAWLALVIAAGLTMGRAIELLAARAIAPPVGAALVIGCAVVLSLPGGALSLWPRAQVWPSRAATERGLELPLLWKTLAAAPPGRVLFVRSGVPLVYGTEWYRPHTHITSLAPVMAGRPIVNGTFTHPSPVAAYVYRGDAEPGALTQLAEHLDGHTLFGRPLEDLGAVLESDGAERLGIAVVVALEDDLPSLSLRAASPPGTWRATSLPPFVVYTRTAAVAMPREIAPNRWLFDADGDPGTWVSAHLAYYPLWRAESGDVPLPTRQGPAGDLEVRLEHRDSAVTLSYRPGLPELTGVALSALVLLALLARRLRRRRHESARATAGSAGPRLAPRSQWTTVLRWARISRSN